MSRKKSPALTVSVLKEYLHYNPDTGVFTWLKLKQKCSMNAGDVAGHIWDGYVRIELLGRNYRAHRLAWFYVYGEWPKYIIDHIDHDRANNRIANLRDVTRTINMQNRAGPWKRSKTGVLGVYWHKHLNRWQAQLQVNGHLMHFGSYTTIEAATAARLAAERLWFPEKPQPEPA